ncbi:long-chain-fatty-acid--CoA ligase [Kocuria dechangensis]|uniref:Acyl-CoA synthetase n=1 Tax=Kocuria dechangensis TaxID=1176249 RepID=A0A917GZW7_9MICC|nr:long-chain fatty acid--CoA ligase [Kocuria dechangensis]GGG63008.1 long-chain-fatty-acid--CoA ligase [Kocuria dechangensis]
MRHVATDAFVDPPLHTRITDFLLMQADRPEDPHLYTVLSADGAAREVRAREFLASVRGVAKGLVAAGIGPGDRVGILSRTRYEWSLVDFAVWYAGAVPVPVYDSSSPQQIAWIMGDSDAKAVFVETEALEQGVLEAARETPFHAAENIWRLDGTGSDLDDLTRAGADVPDEELEARRTSRGLEDVATIIYTSGTTGPPKGCELTHGNFVRLCENTALVVADIVHPGARTLLFLPLAHVFARFVEVIALYTGTVLAHTPDVKNLMADLESFRPTFILAVPRVFEKIYQSARLKSEKGGTLKSLIFARAAATAVSFSKAQQAGRVLPLLRARHALYDRLVYSKLRAAMGGEVTHAVSGGAALGTRLGHFFNGIGVYVVEGYGLTETTAPIAVNTPEVGKIGTVGLPLPGNEIRIAEDGEVLVRGAHVMRGYHGREDLTAAAFEDGWFRTGDLGSLDEDGALSITGRKKEIIVTAGGKNVVPNVLEDPIRASALVSQVMVVGDDRPFVAALITLDQDVLPARLELMGLDPAMPVAEAARHPKVVEHVQEIVDQANKAVSRAEGIRAFEILDVDWTEASGHLTPSMKIKRAKIAQDFADRIEEIYSRPAPEPAPAGAAERIREKLAGAHLPGRGEG